jgi:hypothetical protein
MLRDSVTIAFAIVNLALFYSAVAAFPEVDFAPEPAITRVSRVLDQVPCHRPIAVASQLWYWGELLVVLMNRRRRSLHDYLAGTVVVRESWGVTSPQPLRQSALKSDQSALK